MNATKLAVSVVLLAATLTLAGCTKTKIKDSTVETEPDNTVVVPADSTTTIVR